MRLLAKISPVEKVDSMRLRTRFLIAIPLIFFAFAGVAANAAESGADPRAALTVKQFKDALPETSQELSLQGLLDLQRAGAVTLLDLRDKDAFARRHIKGSLNAPLTGLTEKTLPAMIPDRKAAVVLICDYSFMPTRMIPMTLQAYPVLKGSGYTQIYRLNLWDDPAHKKMIAPDAQEKLLPFEGTEVKAK